MKRNKKYKNPLITSRPKKLTSRIMRLVKSSNTKPEIILRKALWNSGLKGYRLHWSKIKGKPDITYVGKKLAIFVHGCFWHRCPVCKRPIPKSNYNFWKEKFRKNKIRDKRNLFNLHKEHWKVITIWECEIKEDLEACVKKIKKEVNRRRL